MATRVGLRSFLRMAAVFGKLEEFVSSRELLAHYVERLGQFFAANDLKDGGRWRAIFLSAVGVSAYRLLRNLASPKIPGEVPYDDLIQVLTTHFCPAPSEIVQRYKFHRLFRQQGQSVAAFEAELRAEAEFCNFGTSLEEMIRDRLVCWISDEQIQRRLLSENKLTLTKALELAQSMELAKKSTEVLSTAKSEIEAGAEEGGVHAVTAARSKPGNLQCSCCGKRGHVQGKCRFKDYKCHTCGAQGICRKCVETAKQRRSRYHQLQLVVFSRIQNSNQNFTFSNYHHTSHW